MRERAAWPNTYQGDEYPLNFFFNGNDNPSEGDVVGSSQIDLWNGKEHRSVLCHVLVWTQDTVVSMSQERYELWRNK